MSHWLISVTNFVDFHLSLQCSKKYPTSSIHNREFVILSLNKYKIFRISYNEQEKPPNAFILHIGHNFLSVKRTKITNRRNPARSVVLFNFAVNAHCHTCGAAAM